MADKNKQQMCFLKQKLMAGYLPQFLLLCDNNKIQQHLAKLNNHLKTYINSNI